LDDIPTGRRTITIRSALPDKPRPDREAIEAVWSSSVDPLVVVAIAGPAAVCICWIVWLVFADRHLRRGESPKAIAEIAKGFWRWLHWRP